MGNTDLDCVKKNIVAVEPQDEECNSQDYDEIEPERSLCDNDKGVYNQDQTLELFKMVFQAAQSPDKNSIKLQNRLTITLIVVLCLQVVWALGVIIAIICLNSSINANALTFITLLVTAILGEVVAMAFVVVRFVFRTPLDIMIELLKDIVNKRK